MRIFHARGAYMMLKGKARLYERDVPDAYLASFRPASFPPKSYSPSAIASHTTFSSPTLLLIPCEQEQQLCEASSSMAMSSR